MNMNASSAAHKPPHATEQTAKGRDNPICFVHPPRAELVPQPLGKPVSSSSSTLATARTAAAAICHRCFYQPAQHGQRHNDSGWHTLPRCHAQPVDRPPHPYPAARSSAVGRRVSLQCCTLQSSPAALVRTCNFVACVTQSCSRRLGAE